MMFLGSWWLYYKAQPCSGTRQFDIFILFQKWVLQVLVITSYPLTFFKFMPSPFLIWITEITSSPSPLLPFLPPSKIHL